MRAKRFQIMSPIPQEGTCSRRGDLQAGRLNDPSIFAKIYGERFVKRRALASIPGGTASAVVPRLELVEA
jgi:hypothetical protein